MRPCPPDFAEQYILQGWETIGEHYRAGWPVIARWVDECGGDKLRAARAKYVLTFGKRRLHVVALD